MKNKEKEKKEQLLKDYFQKKVNPVLQKLVVDLLVDQPTELIDYMQSWLQDKGRKIIDGQNDKSNTNNTNNNNQAFKIEIQETKGYEWLPPVKVQDDEKQNDSEQGDVEAEEEFDEEEFQKIYQNTQKQQDRVSVSQEVYGRFNKKEAYVPRVIKKTENQIQRIQERLLQSFMFSELNEKDRKIVIDAMEEKQFKDDDTVIKQGDDGDVLYLVDQGTLECYRKQGTEQEKYLKTYNPGEAFGELALLYNAPRAATIKSKGDSVCFCLDRECFNNIVKDSSIKRREKYEEVLKQVDLISSIDPYERTHLYDGLKEQNVKAGEIIIKQGQVGERFCIVQEGTFKAIRQTDKDSEPVEVMNYKEGDYFGEIALIRNICRQATVEALSDGVLVYLDFQTFQKLLGPMEDILKRNEEKYAKYWKADEYLLQMEIENHKLN